MKKLNEASLKVGDIILTTSDAFSSKWIRRGTGGDISHAIIYVQDHSVIDATAEGVHARNTQRLFYKDHLPIYILRVRSHLPDEKVKAICNFVRSKIGTEYSKKEAIRTAWGGSDKWTSRQFCSRLVAQAYDSVGVRLVSDPNYCSPAEIRESPLLVDVPNATMSISDEEVARWEQGISILEMQTQALNTLFNEARKKNKDIQNFDDLNAHLMKHPEDDDYMSGVLIGSSYLSLWEVQADQSPWMYDFDLMNAIPDTTEVEEYCRNLLASEAAEPNRFVANRGGYVRFSKQRDLHYFHLMLELYTVLATLHRKRVDVATKWLEVNRQLAPAAQPVPQPHTAEWFTALSQWNPVQAEITRSILGKTGRTDVCSVCGDFPARDYRLQEAIRPPAGTDTLRLCGDCLKIRADLGDLYDLLPE